jgi:hypothetical protein
MRLLEALHDSYYVPLKAAAARASRDEDGDDDDANDDDKSSANKSASLDQNATPDGSSSNSGGGASQNGKSSSSSSSSASAALAFAPNVPPPLSEADVETVFAHIPAIVALHRQLLADLTARMDDWGAAGRHSSLTHRNESGAPSASSSSLSSSSGGSSASSSASSSSSSASSSAASSSGIGDVLLRFAPFFKIYAALVVAQEASRATLAGAVQTSIPLRYCACCGHTYIV